MNVWLMFLLGVLLGWLIEWLIDWLFWRKNAQRNADENGQLRQSLAQTQAELAAARAKVAETDRLQAQLSAVRAELAIAKRTRETLQLQLERAQAQRTQIRTASTVVDPPHIAPRAADMTLAQLRQELESLRFERDALQDELNKVRYAAGARSFVKRDDLEQIDGIGPVYEQRLFAAGIDTYAQLAAAAPQDVAAIVDAKQWQELNIVSWLEQAAHFAAIAEQELLPDRLEEIKGIGPTYAKRLRAANIRSFEGLAASSTEQLEDILGKGRAADYASWIEQAQQFAGVAHQDRTPSPLEQIKGLGPVFATRLEMAGITDPAALSQLSEEQLREIVGAKGWRLVNYPRWMAQARQLASQRT